jgi:hypothetical protein
MPFDPYVTFAQLPEYGIRFTRVHLLRLMRANQFPLSHQITKNRVAWLRSDIERFLASRPLSRAIAPAEQREAGDAH